MSSFKDTFTKDQKKESLLKYDGTASLFFFSTILICVAIPFTYSLFMDAFFPESKFNKQYIPVGSKKGSAFKYCQCNVCKSKVETARKESASFANRFSRAFFIKLAVLVGMWVAIAHLGFQIASAEENIASFDPFAILGVDKGATEKVIKKAYRMMSLKYHPDKNPNNPQAESMFLLINQAQRALLDEESRKNYEKYGNPDGPSTMKIGIGLPPFLVAEENQIVVLLCFFVLLLIVVPMIVLSYWQKTKKFHTSGLQHETIHLLGSMVTKEIRGVDMPQVLAASAESRELELRPAEDQIITDIGRQCKHLGKMRFRTPIVVRNTVLLSAHLNRLTAKLPATLKADVHTLLKAAVLQTNTIVDICVIRKMLSVAIEAVNFKRQLVQGLPFAAQSPSLLQMPHMTPDLVANLTKPGRNAVTNLAEFVALKPEDRHARLPESFSADQQRDIDNFCDHVTDLEVFCRAETQDEAEIAVNDVVTVNIKVVRRNLREGEAQGPVHSPAYPETKYEELYVFLIDLQDQENPFAGFTKIRGQERVEEVKIQIQAAKPGLQKYRALVLSDSYWGVDKDVTVTFNALTPESANRKVIVHEEDKALDQHPSFLQQLMEMQKEANESDDEEEVVEGDKVRAVRKVRQEGAEDGISSDEESEEESD